MRHSNQTIENLFWSKIADKVMGWSILEFKDPRIDGSPRVHTPTKNNLTIADLSLEDYMVIQCNATNKHNYLWSDVFLNVLGKS